MKGLARICVLALGALTVGSASAVSNVGSLGDRGDSSSQANWSFKSRVNHDDHETGGDDVGHGNRDEHGHGHGLGDHDFRGDRDDHHIHHPPVPEADTWLMLLVGSGLIGYQLRRKQRSVDRSIPQD